MSDNSEKKVSPFGIKDKLGYMFGDFGNDFTFIFASSYLMVFYTKVLGINGCGCRLSVSRGAAGRCVYRCDHGAHRGYRQARKRRPVPSLDP